MFSFLKVKFISVLFDSRYSKLRNTQEVDTKMEMDTDTQDLTRSPRPQFETPHWDWDAGQCATFIIVVLLTKCQKSPTEARQMVNEKFGSGTGAELFSTPDYLWVEWYKIGPVMAIHGAIHDAENRKKATQV